MKLGITMLILNQDDIEFVTEFPCSLGHPVDRKIDDTAMQFLLVQNRHRDQTHDWTLIGSGANEPAYRSARETSIRQYPRKPILDNIPGNQY